MTLIILRSSRKIDQIGFDRRDSSLSSRSTRSSSGQPYRTEEANPCSSEFAQRQGSSGEDSRLHSTYSCPSLSISSSPTDSRSVSPANPLGSQTTTCEGPDLGKSEAFDHEWGQIERPKAHLRPLRLASKATINFGQSTPSPVFPEHTSEKTRLGDSNDIRFQRSVPIMFRSRSKRGPLSESFGETRTDRGPIVSQPSSKRRNGVLRRPGTAPSSPATGLKTNGLAPPRGPLLRRRSSAPDHGILLEQSSKRANGHVLSDDEDGDDDDLDEEGSALRPPRIAALASGHHENASESWSLPEDADGDLVRKAYAHFAKAGVPDDGFVEGQEYTRERSGLPPWEKPPTSITASNSARTGLVASLSNAKAASSLNGISHSTSRSRKSSRLVDVQKSIVNSSDGKTTDPSSSAEVQVGRLDRPPFLPVPREEPVTNTAGGQARGLGEEQAEIFEPSRIQSTASSRLIVHSNYSNQSLESGLSSMMLTSEEWNQRQFEAEAKRLELLSKIDRYGFFSGASGPGSHGRTSVLSAAAFAAQPRRKPKAGKGNLPIKPGDDPASLASSLSESASQQELRASLQKETAEANRLRARSEQENKVREQNRIAKWSKMVEVTERDEGLNATGHGFAGGSDKRLRRRVYKGIPDIWRAAAWEAMIERRRSLSDLSSLSKSLARSRKQLAQRYTRLVQMPSPHDVQIDLDVPRTISGHVMFHTRYGHGQTSLFHVLHAFSLLCVDCAYCQGMGPIAATLLCYFSPEEAYAQMVLLHNFYDLHSTFSQGFPGLVENFYVHEQLLFTILPELGPLFEEQMITTSAYATKWYITLFANSVPFETQLRIWDAMLLEGQDVLVIAAVGIVWALRDKILAPNATFETILGLLSSFFVPEDDNALMKWIELAMNRKDIIDRMSTARKEWKVLVERGEASKRIL